MPDLGHDLQIVDCIAFTLFWENAEEKSGVCEIPHVLFMIREMPGKCLFEVKQPTFRKCCSSILFSALHWQKKTFSNFFPLFGDKT